MVNAISDSVLRRRGANAGRRAGRGSHPATSFYAAFALLASLIGVAGLFLLAFAEFLALVQLLIYGGAIVIVILFALMLNTHPGLRAHFRQSPVAHRGNCGPRRAWDCW